MNQILTIEKIKKRNISKQKIFSFISIIALLCIPASFYIANEVFLIEKNIAIALFSFVLFFIFPFIAFIILMLQAKKIKKHNKNLDNGDFIVVKDKVYDKLKTRTSTGNDTRYRYYIFTKLYGKISVNFATYNNVNKDDSVFLLLYSKNDKITSFDLNINEYKRNTKIINFVYQASKCTLGPDLINNLIPYNETIADKVFNERINFQINQLKKHKKYIKCKHCSKKYNRLTHLDCPKCGCAFVFDISNVLYSNS